MTLGVLEPLLRELIGHAEEARLQGLTPRVAFDCDKTLIDGDIGEATLASMTLSGSLPERDAWWEPLGAVLSAEALQNLIDRYQRARQAMSVSPELFSELWGAYEALCQADIKAGYLYAARIWLGCSLSGLQARSAEAVSRALAMSLAPCPHAGGLVSRGVRPRPVMRALIDALHQADIEVWVVSSSERSLVQALTPHLGVMPERVIAIDFEPHAGLVSAQPVEPCPIGSGKTERYLSVHEHPPLGMFGDSRHDLPLMQTAGWGALIDHGHVELLQRATALGAHIIPAAEVSAAHFMK